MIKQIGHEAKPLTRDLTERINSLPALKGDRDLKQWRVDQLRSLHDQGLFHGPTWVVAKIGNKMLRINGNHSSTMLLGLNGVFPRGMRATILTFACDNMQDAADLWAQFDTRWSARSEAEQVSTHGKLHSELASVSPTDMKNAVNGIAVALTECGATGSTDSMSRAHLVHDNVAFIVWTEQFIGMRRMRKSGVIGAMFATYNRNKAVATEFWKHVRDESHPDTDNATRKLARFLRECVVGRDGSGHIIKWSTRAFYAKSIHAWNAYRRGDRTDLKYHETSALPVAA